MDEKLRVGTARRAGAAISVTTTVLAAAVFAVDFFRMAPRGGPPIAAGIRSLVVIESFVAGVSIALRLIAIRLFRWIPLTVRIGPLEWTRRLDRMSVSLRPSRAFSAPQFDFAAQPGSIERWRIVAWARPVAFATLGCCVIASMANGVSIVDPLIGVYLALRGFGDAEAMGWLFTLARRPRGEMWARRQDALGQISTLRPRDWSFVAMESDWTERGEVASLRVELAFRALDRGEVDAARKFTCDAWDALRAQDRPGEHSPCTTWLVATLAYALRLDSGLQEDIYDFASQRWPNEPERRLYEALRSGGNGLATLGHEWASDEPTVARANYVEALLPSLATIE